MTEAPSTRREARLLPEFADFHTGVTPGVWLGASEVADLVMEHASTADQLGLHPRALDPRHFEFRGGVSGVARPADALTRLYDQ
jgi:hypothetical protein